MLAESTYFAAGSRNGTRLTMAVPSEGAFNDAMMSNVLYTHCVRVRNDCTAYSPLGTSHARRLVATSPNLSLSCAFTVLLSSLQALLVRRAQIQSIVQKQGISQEVVDANNAETIGAVIRGMFINTCSPSRLKSEMCWLGSGQLVFCRFIHQVAAHCEVSSLMCGRRLSSS